MSNYCLLIILHFHFDIKSSFFLQDNIPDNVISLVQPYIHNEEFQPASIAKVSKACTSLCQWVRAMYNYYFVAKDVAPKRVNTEIHVRATTIKI